MSNAVNPGQIIEVGLGFWASKVLLSAVEIDLFSVLAKGPLELAEIESRIGLHPRGSRDFLDALVALGFLLREGEGAESRYANTPETDLFLDRNKASFVGGILQMANERIYPIWASFTAGLRTGMPQNEIKTSGKSFFEQLYADPVALETFMQAMAGISLGPCAALAEKFDFSRHTTLVDAGGATGQLSITVARRHPHLQVISVDLPPVEPIAKRTIAAAGVSDRVKTASIDFFAEPLPKADVITMVHILHDWDLSQKTHLVRSAYEALPDGGALIVVDNIIDDARRENAFGLLMSLNMLMETPGGFDYTGADFARWARDVGFGSVEVIPLAGPTSAAIAIK